MEERFGRAFCYSETQRERRPEGKQPPRRALLLTAPPAGHRRAPGPPPPPGGCSRAPPSRTRRVGGPAPSLPPRAPNTCWHRPPFVPAMTNITYPTERNCIIYFFLIVFPLEFHLNFGGAGGLGGSEPSPGPGPGEGGVGGQERGAVRGGAPPSRGRPADCRRRPARVGGRGQLPTGRRGAGSTAPEEERILGLNMNLPGSVQFVQLSCKSSS